MGVVIVDLSEVTGSYSAMRFGEFLPTTLANVKLTVIAACRFLYFTQGFMLSIEVSSSELKLVLNSKNITFLMNFMGAKWLQKSLSAF